MEENDKNINIDIKSQTLEKAIDKLAIPIYNDLVHKPLETCGNSINTLFRFIHNFALYPMQKYNIYAESKLENYVAELKKKTETISMDNLVEPRVNILGPTIDGLKYNLDEEHIKEMFTNILVSEIDNRKQNKVLPSYIGIVNQLSQNDAISLKFLKEMHPIIGIQCMAPIIHLKYLNKISNGHFDASNDTIFVIDEKKYEILDSIVVDNLVRLNLIQIDYSRFLHDKPYEDVFRIIKSCKEFENCSATTIDLDYSKGILSITDFGKNFIDICLS